MLLIHTAGVFNNVRPFLSIWDPQPGLVRLSTRWWAHASVVVEEVLLRRTTYRIANSNHLF